MHIFYHLNTYSLWHLLKYYFENKTISLNLPGVKSASRVQNDFKKTYDIVAKENDIIRVLLFFIPI